MRKVWEQKKDEMTYLNGQLEVRLTSRDNEIKALKDDTIPSHVRKVERLEGEAEGLRDQILDLQQQLEQAVDKEESLVFDKAVLDEDNAQLVRLNTVHRETVDMLEGVLAETETWKSNLATEKTALQAENAELSSRISTLTDDVSTLRNVHSMMKSENDGLAREKSALAATNSELNRRMTMLTYEVSDVRDHLEKANAENSKLVREKEALNTKNSGLGKKQVELEMEVIRLRDQFGQSETQRMILESDKAALEPGLNATVAGLNIQESMLAAQVTPLTEKNAKLSDAFVALTEKNHELLQKVVGHEGSAVELFRPSSVLAQSNSERQGFSSDPNQDYADAVESEEEHDEVLDDMQLPLLLHVERAHSQISTADSSSEEHDTVPDSTSEEPPTREESPASKPQTIDNEPTGLSSSDSADAQASIVAQSQDQQVPEGSSAQTSNMKTLKTDSSALESAFLPSTASESSTSDTSNQETSNSDASCSDPSETGPLTTSASTGSRSSNNPPHHLMEPIHAETSPASSQTTSVEGHSGPPSDNTPNGREMTKKEFEIIRNMNGRVKVLGVKQEQDFIRFLVHETLCNNTKKVLGSLPDREDLSPHLEGRPHREQFLALMNDHLACHVTQEAVWAFRKHGGEVNVVGKNVSIVLAWLFLHEGLTMREAILAAWAAGRSDQEVFCSLLRLGFKEREILDALIQLKPNSRAKDFLQILEDCGRRVQKWDNEWVRTRVNSDSLRVQPKAPVKPKAPLQATAASFIPDTVHQQGPAASVALPTHATELHSLMTAPQVTAPMTTTKNGLAASRYSQQPDNSEPVAESSTNLSSALGQPMESPTHSPSLPAETMSGPSQSGLHASKQSKGALPGLPPKKPKNSNGSYHGHYIHPPNSISPAIMPQHFISSWKIANNSQHNMNAHGWMPQNPNGWYHSHNGHQLTSNVPGMIQQNYNNGQWHHEHASNSIQFSGNASEWTAQPTYGQQDGNFIPNGRGRDGGRGGGRGGQQFNRHRGGY
jgi:uncharacterized protein (UPF0335 family)